MSDIETSQFLAEGKRDNFHDGRAYAVEWDIWEIAYWEQGADGKDIASKGDPFAKGFVKWDGCSNWTFHTIDCMFHACDRERLVAIGEILSRCWDASAALMPETWSGEANP